MIVKPTHFQRTRLARSLLHHFSLNLTPLVPYPDLNIPPHPPHPRIIECGFNYELIIFVIVSLKMYVI